MLYRCIKFHTRYPNGIVKLYRPGDLIYPTKFELVSFPDRFVLVENLDPGEVPPTDSLSVEVEEPVTKELSKEESLENVTDIDEELVKAKQSLRDIIDNSEEWEPSVITDANKLYAKNPQRADKKTELVKLINDFVSELE